MGLWALSSSVSIPCFHYGVCRAIFVQKQFSVPRAPDLALKKTPFRTYIRGPTQLDAKFREPMHAQAIDVPTQPRTCLRRRSRASGVGCTSVIALPPLSRLFFPSCIHYTFRSVQAKFGSSSYIRSIHIDALLSISRSYLFLYIRILLSKSSAALVQLEPPVFYGLFVAATPRVYSPDGHTDRRNAKVLVAWGC